MGFIANLIKAQEEGTRPSFRERIATQQDASRAVWHDIFRGVNNTSKEEAHSRQNPVPGGSHGRSFSSSSASYKRLLEAMRSMAPGGWSDDRWEQSRHYVGIAYVCLHRMGEQLAQAEFQVFEKDDTHTDGKRPVRKHHPAYKLINLLEKPNKEDSFGDMMYRWNLQMGLTGKALTWMVPNRLGSPMELYSIPTAVAIPQPCINPDFPDGFYRIQPVYPYGPFSTFPTPASAVGAAIPAQWMMEFKYPHPLLRYDGYSPLTALRLHLDEIESVDRSRWYSMKRTFQPSAVLDMSEMEGAQPLSEPEIERIKAEWENEFQGDYNTGKVIVGSPGVKIEPWGQRPVDMDYQQGWEQLTSFAMAGFGITKPAAGMIEDSSYATLFATLKQLHLLTLSPLCSRIAGRLTRMLAPFFGEDLIVEIRCPKIDDHEIKFQKTEKLTSTKAGTKNEVRKLLDMPITKEKWGDDIAGDPSPAEKEQQQAQQQGMGGGMQEGMPGVEQQPQEQPNPLDALMQAGGDAEQVPEEQLASGQPSPGPLGAGALGPRKSLSKALVKTKKKQTKTLSMYEMTRKVLANGHHK